jgi:hypothetical protein
MAPSNNDIVRLAQQIYVKELTRLGSNAWDFKPVAVKALQAAEQFFIAAEETLAVPSAPAPPVEQTQAQSDAPSNPS